MHFDPSLWDVSWSMVAEKFVRAAFVYGTLLVLLRLGGKRELAQLNSMDFVVFMTLSNAVQNAIIGNDNSSLIGGFLGATSLMVISRTLVWARVRFDNPRLDALVEGTEDVLIHCGKVQHDRLRKELMTLEDLQIAARNQGFRTLQEIDFAALEPGGGIIFCSKQPTQQDERFNALFARIDELSRDVRALRESQQAR